MTASIKQIDQLVYKLYNLTPEEIEIVEKNTKKQIDQMVYKFYNLTLEKA